MVYYTIVPTDELFDEENEGSTERLLEIKRSGMTMLVNPTSHGRGRIQRLISSNPADYLNPTLQPGSEIIFGVDDVVTEM